VNVFCLQARFDALEQLVGREQSECAQQLGFLHLGFASIMCNWPLEASLVFLPKYLVTVSFLGFRLGEGGRSK